jgi:hypothetical protein
MFPMFTKDLSRFIGEVRRAIRNHKWEQHKSGILIPGGVLVGGEYSYSHNKGPWSDPEKNLLPTEGLLWLLKCLDGHGTPVASYIALHANTTTVLATHTAAGYTATFGEITSGSEGYEESTRVEWVTADPSVTAVMNNYASPASFTIITASTLTVNGVALLTASAKGATTGALVSASKFGATRTFSDDDTFDVKYQLGLTSS